MSKFTIAFVAATLFAFVGAVDFMPVNPVPQGATAVTLGPECAGEEIPKVMYTIEPTNDDKQGIQVFSYPADLVTVATDSDTVLQLVWNSQVSATATEGGVRILFPASQLQEVTVSADAHAQVLDGFTNLRRLRASSDAKLFATVTNNAATNLSLKVSSDANVAMISNIPLTDVSASSDAIVELEAPLVAEVSVSSDATVFFKGSIGNAQVSSDGKLTVQGNTHTAQISSDGRIRLYGSLTGGAELSSDAVLYAQTIDPAATIQARSDATVFAPTCSNVSTRSDAKCRVQNVTGQVTVDVPQQPPTRQGTESGCGNGSALGRGAIGGIAAAGVVLVAAAVLWRCCKPTKKGPNLPTSYPAAHEIKELPHGIVLGYEETGQQETVQSNKNSCHAGVDNKEAAGALHS